MPLFSAFPQRPLCLFTLSREGCVIFFFASLFLLPFLVTGCRKSSDTHLTIGSKFFTKQVILAELLTQHIEARTVLHFHRKSNLRRTLLFHKDLLSRDLDLYVEYTGTALTAVLNETP